MGASVDCPRAASLALAVLLAGLAGCSSGPRVVKVTGTVKRAGKPLSNVQLRFTPENVNKQKMRMGAEQGTHTVVVRFVARNPQEEMKGFAKPPDAKAILEKYGDKDKPQLKYEIKDDGQDIEVNLD
jgi:hypothetical protein